MRTPTVLVLDADGELVTRASGQPRKVDVIAAVGRAVEAKAAQSNCEPLSQIMRHAMASRNRPPYSRHVAYTTLLTKRRAVDNCRMRSSLCRMP